MSLPRPVRRTKSSLIAATCTPWMRSPAFTFSILPFGSRTSALRPSAPPKTPTSETVLRDRPTCCLAGFCAAATFCARHRLGHRAHRRRLGDLAHRCRLGHHLLAHRGGLGDRLGGRPLLHQRRRAHHLGPWCRRRLAHRHLALGRDLPDVLLHRNRRAAGRPQRARPWLRRPPASSPLAPPGRRPASASEPPWPSVPPGGPAAGSETAAVVPRQRPPGWPPRTGRDRAKRRAPPPAGRRPGRAAAARAPHAPRRARAPRPERRRQPARPTPPAAASGVATTSPPAPAAPAWRCGRFRSRRPARARASRPGGGAAPASPHRSARPRGGDLGKPAKRRPGARRVRDGKRQVVRHAAGGHRHHRRRGPSPGAASASRRSAAGAARLQPAGRPARRGRYRGGSAGHRRTGFSAARRRRRRGRRLDRAAMTRSARRDQGAGAEGARRRRGSRGSAGRRHGQPPSRGGVAKPGKAPSPTIAAGRSPTPARSARVSASVPRRTAATGKDPPAAARRATTVTPRAASRARRRRSVRRGARAPRRGRRDRPAAPDLDLRQDDDEAAAGARHGRGKPRRRGVKSGESGCDLPSVRPARVSMTSG